MTTIAVINESTLLSDIELEPMVAAVQEDIARNVGPVWNVSASIVQVPQGGQPPAGAWWMLIIDDATMASALGYHELTPEGLPLGRVFVRTTQQYGQTVSRVLSHEVVEMLVDPMMRRVVQIGALFYSVEPGDPLSLDFQGRMVLGQLMSGVALPDYYYRTGARYDFGGHLPGPCPAIAPGGGTFLSAWNGSSWASTMNAATPDEFIYMQASDGSRRHRRMMKPEAWRASERVSTPVASVEARGTRRILGDPRVRVQVPTSQPGKAPEA